ncbi:Pyridoxal phosphate-dependent transferase major region subdomain 1 [Diaporthe amygdali]|uniref:Pyridoxal phosphate-dependent transferase major region subdomain 1 n=1 Tax=Phomopsis amygdali TaxID=1214568 RepID=UPI0022FF1886|nr:Pyridoxal phosphate-dependent transferase major region subdomain 1 [Diaporthe amygdali]KAJ0117905.1 Pyridoxal phosphate-dependent transferase major region subdomain 1 [Diaporthe amygdali]
MSYSTTEPLSLTHHFSRASKTRRPNPLKEYYKYLFVPGMCNFSGGLPHPDIFPFEALDLSLNQPLRNPILNHKETDHPSGNYPDIRVRIPRRVGEDHPGHKVDLSTALQYGSAQGYTPLYTWLRKLVNLTYHPNIPYQGGADVIIDGGSADGLSKVFELLFNPWNQDLDDIQNREGLIVEDFVYGPPLSQIRPKNVNIVPVTMDAEGMLAHGAGSLSDVLQNWDFSKGKRPHVVYTIPTGQNPTSGVLSFERRKEIYAVCSKFDLVLIEDDPYWNLFYPSTPSISKQYRGLSAPTNFPTNTSHNYCTESLEGRSTGYRFLDELIPSFLSLDKDGRVIRLDSFSKSIAPGCRLGWITAQPSVCEQLFKITDDTTQQPSGFVQAIITRLIGELGSTGNVSTAWGLEGWVRWLEGLRSAYERRMIKLATALERNKVVTSATGQTKMFDFQWPMGGMFLWVEVNIFSHPLVSTVGPKRLMRALWIRCTQHPYRILTVPGGDFAATESVKGTRGFLFLRFCFAAVEEDLLEAKAQSFAEACREFWSIQSSNDIDEIMRDEDALESSHREDAA